MEVNLNIGKLSGAVPPSLQWHLVVKIHITTPSAHQIGTATILRSDYRPAAWCLLDEVASNFVKESSVLHPMQIRPHKNAGMRDQQNAADNGERRCNIINRPTPGGMEKMVVTHFFGLPEVHK
ncbi:unnamed protein product [Dibothriocephalus latus]|uniref:Uncharacterized protein n=1 Tax=Dibothriocephalus latus TaxID=60516 RepID=A0A3P6TBZ8_DIBLA|nr:unnamed protein product [Dibothriocephalus latus]